MRYQISLHTLSNRPYLKHICIPNTVINLYSKPQLSNFSITGFDRDPMISLIVEAKKNKDVNEVNILDKRNFEYSTSLLDDKKFKLKCNMLTSISNIIDNQI